MGSKRPIVRLGSWIVPVLVGGTVLASYGLAKTVRFPTQTVVVEDRRISPGATPAVVEFTVRNLKCWTMSGLFTDRMTEEPGVLEIVTFVRTNTARITYDPSRTSPERLTDAIERPIENPETGETARVFVVKEARVF